ncbi:MAG: cytochrome c [Sandaracinaceae bacterium]|nr:cytochrome c [Sandaracinaceae bacterium]
MKKVLIRIAASLALLVLLAGAAFAYASHRAGSILGHSYAAHEVDFPVPMPMSPDEIPEGEDPDAFALASAIERGRHLVRARYACADCHGEDLSGGVMIDDPAMGRLLGPNLTSGKGSIVSDYTPSDWDRLVRHGIRPDGRPALMPSEDFMAMSDRELSDLVAYIGSLPPIDNEVPPSALGPVGRVLVALGKFPLSARMIPDHDRPHRVEPPEAAVTLEFGQHLAQVCTGCHRQNFEGGAIVQGPPDWPAATNLTLHEDGLAGYDLETFRRVMREGIRPDGEPVRAPMDIASILGANMTDIEIEALWLFFSSLTPIPMGK